MTSLEQRCHEQGIKFSATNSCMCCMPHTIHLQVNLYQLGGIEYWLTDTSSFLRALGIFQNQKARKLQHRMVITKTLFWHLSHMSLMKMLWRRRTLMTVRMQLKSWQRQLTWILFSLQLKRYEMGCLSLNLILTYLQLWKIVKAVWYSPQHHQNWVWEIQFVQINDECDECSVVPLMLILDVRMQWSSTHQMLCKFST